MGKTIKRLSDNVKMIWGNIHHLRKKQLSKWEKEKKSRNVEFVNTYTEKKLKKVITYVEEEKDYRIRVVIPPMSKNPLRDFRVHFEAEVPASKRKELREEIYPIVRRFISRYSL